MDKYAAASITSLLDIPVTTLFLSWGSYTGSQYFGNATSPPTFDFADYCMQMGLNNNFYERYSQFFTGAQGVWGHYGNYTNPTVTADLDQLDLYPKFSAQQNATASEIQEIIGHDQPFIPLGGHAVWYIYSDYYWTGWASNSTGNRILSAGPFGGSANEAQIQMITYRLTTTGHTETTTPVSTITSIITSGGAADYTLVIVGAVIVVVAVVAVGLVLMRRKPGK
jgi:ABC-type transport system substrate-binding protein